MGALLVIFFVLYMARRSGGAARQYVAGEYRREADRYRQRLDDEHPEWSQRRRHRVAGARAFGAATADMWHLLPAVGRAVRRGAAEAREEWGTTREDHEAWRARHRDEVAERRDRRRARRRARQRGTAIPETSRAASPALEQPAGGSSPAVVVDLPRRRRGSRAGDSWPEAPAVRSGDGWPDPAPGTPADPAPFTPADPAPFTPADPAPFTPAPFTPAPFTPADPAPGTPARPWPPLPAPFIPPPSGPADTAGRAPVTPAQPGSQQTAPQHTAGSSPANPTGDSDMTTPTGETTRYEQTNIALGSFSDAAGETLAAAEAVALPVVQQARAIAAAAEQLQASVGATGMTDATLNIEIQDIRGGAADLAAACEEFEQQRMKVMELAMALDSQARNAQSGHIQRHGRIVEAVHAAGGAARDTRYYGND